MLDVLHVESAFWCFPCSLQPALSYRKDSGTKDSCKGSIWMS